MLSTLLLGGDVRAGPPKELIVKVSQLSEWAVYKIRRQLSCLDGVHFSGYDSHSSCLLMQYDTHKIADSKLIIQIISGLNKSLKLTEISGYTIFDVLDGKLKQSTTHTHLHTH